MNFPFAALITALVVGFVVAQIGTFITTVYLHRGLAHRSLKLHPAVEFVCRFLTWVTTGMKPRQWVAVHRKHHAYTDQPEDPHSPKQLGWIRVQLTNAALYRRVATNPVAIRKYARDLPPDRWDRILFDRAFVGLGLGIALLIVVFGPWVGLAAAGVHAVSYLMLNAAVNAITHTFGKQPFANGATNLQWLAFLTAGEGLHNNHHAAPTSAKLSLSPGEIDPSWPAIRLLRRFGLATIRIDAQKAHAMAQAA